MTSFLVCMGLYVLTVQTIQIRSYACTLPSQQLPVSCIEQVKVHQKIYAKSFAMDQKSFQTQRQDLTTDLLEVSMILFDSKQHLLRLFIPEQLKLKIECFRIEKFLISNQVASSPRQPSPFQA